MTSTNSIAVLNRVPEQIYPGDNFSTIIKNPVKSVPSRISRSPQTSLMKKVTGYFRNLALAFLGLPSQQMSPPSVPTKEQFARRPPISPQELEQLQNSIQNQQKAYKDAQGIISDGFSSRNNPLYG